MKNHIISNSDDVIDSRDVIERLEELQAEKEDLENGELEAWEKENGEELKALEELAADGEGYGDWDHGETLIRDTYFAEYAEELASDICAIDRNAIWPLNHIDWEAAAEELKTDYICLSFDGIDYWMRA